MFVFLKLNSNMGRHQVNVENSSPKALDPAPRGSACVHTCRCVCTCVQCAHVWMCVRVCSACTHVDVCVFHVRTVDVCVLCVHV